MKYRFEALAFEGIGQVSGRLRRPRFRDLVLPQGRRNDDHDRIFRHSLPFGDQRQAGLSAMRLTPLFGNARKEHS